MIISIDVKKAFDRVQQPFMINTFKNLGVEEAFINKVKAIHKKPNVNIIFNGKKLKSFPLRSGTIQGSLLSALLFNAVLGVLAIVHVRKRNKRHPNWKGGSKTAIVCR